MRDFLVSYTDLIETYWDVKTYKADEDYVASIDLIETYWDVKNTAYEYFVKSYRI